MMEIEELEKNTHLKPMKRTRTVKTVKYLKIYEPKLPNPLWDNQDQAKTRNGG